MHSRSNTFRPLSACTATMLHSFLHYSMQPCVHSCQLPEKFVLAFKNSPRAWVWMHFCSSSCLVCVCTWICVWKVNEKRKYIIFEWKKTIFVQQKLSGELPGQASPHKKNIYATVIYLCAHVMAARLRCKIVRAWKMTNVESADSGGTATSACTAPTHVDRGDTSNLEWHHVVEICCVRILSLLRFGAHLCRSFWLKKKTRLHMPNGPMAGVLSVRLYFVSVLHV